MRTRFILITGALVAAGLVAVVVYAQLTDTQTASGTVTVSSTAADLYICEPGSTPGPECGSDDNGADEAVFETLENVRPGGVVEWDIRIKNTGSQDFVVNGATLGIVETVDPGADCPDDALRAGLHPSAIGFGSSTAGVFVLGKAGDDLNDNPYGLSGVPHFLRELNPFSFPQFVNIKVAGGDYEDLRLRLQLPVSYIPGPSPTAFPAPTPISTENCAGNEWSVSWVLTAL